MVGPSASSRGKMWIRQSEHPRMCDQTSLVCMAEVPRCPDRWPVKSRRGYTAASAGAATEPRRRQNTEWSPVTAAVPSADAASSLFGASRRAFSVFGSVRRDVSGLVGSPDRTSSRPPSIWTIHGRSSSWRRHTIGWPPGLLRSAARTPTEIERTWAIGAHHGWQFFVAVRSYS